MKKLTAILVCIALLAAGVFAFAGCGKQNAKNEGPDENGLAGGEIAGGWTKAASPEITEAFKTVFGKATETLTGEQYIPVAYLASQVVAGTNHCVLCKATATVPGAETTYAIVYVYEDLNGGAQITGVESCDAQASLSADDGGWSEPASPALTEDTLQAMAKACEALAGMEYTPLALLATQVVAGMNYRVLCEARATVPGAGTEYAILTVYADPQGNAAITEMAVFTADSSAQIANPTTEYGSKTESLDDAEKEVGFTLTLPGRVTPENYIVISGVTLEVDFDGGYLRKAKGTGDISGDFNEYDTLDTETADGKTVTLKGNAGKVMLAVWTEGDYTYCIGIPDGTTEAEMLSLVQETK